MAHRRTEWEQEIRVAYDAGDTLRVLGQRYGTTDATLLRALATTGGTRTIAEATLRRSRRRPGGTFFDHIEAEPQAYWFGFIVAEGSISYKPGRQTVHIASAARDGNHLRKLATVFNAPVHERDRAAQRGRKATRCAELRLGVAAADALMYKGIEPRKSHANDLTAVLAHVPSELWRHFLRGMIDGDGWAFRNRSGGVTLGISGNAPLVMALRDHANEQLGVARNLVQTDPRAHVSFGKTKWSHRLDVRKLRDWLYAGATVWLERKRDICDSLVPPDGSWYRGVARRREGWTVKLYPDGRAGRVLCVGQFPSEIEAARAYDVAARELYGSGTAQNLVP